ncbi:hypothetical protein BJX66DRAFT_110267 [Aspergillus keveii]|uniref:Uncharacterized protein n=1 Tax=Aspergillus keveii TaxID=714993 RepID=A0ABR4FKW1_9EURO
MCKIKLVRSITNLTNFRGNNFHSTNHWGRPLQPIECGVTSTSLSWTSHSDASRLVSRPAPVFLSLQLFIHCPASLTRIPLEISLPYPWPGAPSYPTREIARDEIAPPSTSRREVLLSLLEQTYRLLSPLRYISRARTPHSPRFPSSFVFSSRQYRSAKA